MITWFLNFNISNSNRCFKTILKWFFCQAKFNFLLKLPQRLCEYDNKYPHKVYIRPFLDFEFLLLIKVILSSCVHNTFWNSVTYVFKICLFCYLLFSKLSILSNLSSYVPTRLRKNIWKMSHKVLHHDLLQFRFWKFDW